MWPFLRVPVSPKLERLCLPKLVYMYVTSRPTCIIFLSRFRSIKFLKHFINKQAKSKDEIDQLKRKVEHYEEQLQEIKQGRGGSSGDIVLSSHIKYNKVRNHFSRIRHLG